MPARTIKGHFIEPMLLLRTEMLPTGPAWVYELKLDGYRAGYGRSRPGAKNSRETKPAHSILGL